ncbi:hypothetical protein IFR05_003968 [Cadophora sp. M221]|nr:hypothetical protein IFR05_003968 [Cadophora sp. M221]
MSKPDRITDGKEKTAIFDQVSSVHRLQSNPQSLLIGTSGSFRGETSAALAIYFGPDSRHNFSSSIPKGQVKRQEDSDLYAATMALETIQSSDLTTDLKLIVVKICKQLEADGIEVKFWPLHVNIAEFCSPSRLTPFYSTWLL